MPLLTITLAVITKNDPTQPQTRFSRRAPAASTKDGKTCRLDNNLACTSHLQTTAVNNKVYNSGTKHCNKPSKTIASSRRDTALSELPFAVNDEQHIPDYSIMRRMLHVLAGVDVAT